MTVNNDIDDDSATKHSNFHKMGGESDEEWDDEFEVPVDWNEDVEEAKRLVNESNKSTEHTP